MDLSASERTVLGWVQEKCWFTGKLEAGYLLRRRALEALGETLPVDTSAGIAGLVDKGLLAPTASGDRLYLTVEGATFLTALAERLR